MNEHGRRSQVKAYLVVELDFTSELPVVRGFEIHSTKPYHERGRGPNRAWASFMVRTAGSFDSARREVLADVEALARTGNRVYRQILRLMDEAPDEATHVRRYGLSRALDEFVASMPTPNHPFFREDATRSEERTPVVDVLSEYSDEGGA